MLDPCADHCMVTRPPLIAPHPFCRCRSLTDLFAGDPDCAAKGRERAALSRSHLFAGSQLDHELDLRKLQVFVRIRPSVTAGDPHAKGQPRWEPENCVHATSKHSIAIAPPEGSQAYKSGDRGQTYSFSRVFERATGQAEYYEHTAAPLVRGLAGRDCAGHPSSGHPRTFVLSPMLLCLGPAVATWPPPTLSQRLPRARAGA